MTSLNRWPMNIPTATDHAILDKFSVHDTVMCTEHAHLEFPPSQQAHFNCHCCGFNIYLRVNQCLYL